MTRYSDFVKRYMKQSGKNWNCAVCDIKKGDLYNDFKKGEDKQIKSDNEMMGGEDMDAPAKIKKKVIRKKKLVRVVEQLGVNTLEPSPIPPPMALEPADPNTRTNMALGEMPELLGAMIQDFARPTKDTLKRRRQELQVKRNILYAILHTIRNRTHHFIETHDLSFTERKKTAYHNKLDSMIKKVKNYATIEEDPEEFDDEMYNLIRAPEKLKSYMFRNDVDPDLLVALEYLKKHKFRLFLRYTHYDLMGNWNRDKMNIWTLAYGGDKEGRKGSDITKSLINELSEMRKELK
jgi:hypothetical protein